MISAAAWVARGKARQHPAKYAVDDAELARVAALANLQFDDAKATLHAAQMQMAGDGPEGEWRDEDDDSGSSDAGDAGMDETPAASAAAAAAGKPESNDPDDLSRYNLDTYDDEPVASTTGPFSNIKGLQYYRNNDEDPYITLKDDIADEEEERQELEVLPSDNLIVCAKTEDDVSLLECYVYASGDSNLYVHHDLMLPSFPLALEWLDYAPAGGPAAAADQNSAQARGNYIAVGTMDPEIEVWSMDTVEGLYPDAILGSRERTKNLGTEMSGTGKKKRRIPKKRVANADYHVDAVLGLSWNRTARNLLASASADCTVKLWDLSRAPTGDGEGTYALRSFDKIHSDKVQSVAWNTSGGNGGQASVLLSGSYDKTMRVFDARSPDVGVVARVAADVEAVRWNAWREHNFMASFEDGLVQSFDARMLSSAVSPPAVTPTLFTLSAHTGACTSLDISPHIPGCIVTGGDDRTVKLWSIEEEGEAQKPKSISMVASRDLDAGKIFSATFSPNDALTLAVAGSNGTLRIWDALSNVGVRKTFGDRLRAMPADLAPSLDEEARGDGVVMLADEGSEESDDDEALPADAEGDVAMEE